ncbi:MAG TPA: pilus assembly PilX N-terminal domain-containing protein [Vicinamibacterales bacterium]|nr:pilus assembly PilX N-terminal domain-containing protein [Vicinamibacterales bacterium]
MRPTATHFRSAAGSERGIALVGAILTVMLLTAVGMALMYASSLDTVINASYRDKQVAQYAAVSGVQEARDRIQPSNVVAAITAPVLLPALGAANVIYIVNPNAGEAVQPWNTANPYFDNELCQEQVLGLTGTAGIPCTTTAAGTWYSVTDDSQSSSAPWNLASPLATKWTRIMLKANNMGVVPVNGDSSVSTQVCWDGTRQVLLPANYVGRNCGPSHKVVSVIVTNAGNGYTQQPVITIDAPDAGGTQATATAVWQPVPNGQVGSIVVTNAGGGYTSAPSVTITGVGTGATAYAEIVNPGAPLQSLSLSNAGRKCYASAPSVSITGGGGGGATGVAALDSSYDCIYSITVGGNCPTNDTITFTVTGGAGSGFSASTYTTPQGGNDHIFNGLGLSIINPGTGYNGTPITVTASGSRRSCNGVTATASFGYFVNGLTLGNPGANYQSVPSVTLGGGVGSGVLAPTATATLGTPPPDAQTVTRVTLTNPGSGYTTAPTVTFSGGGGSGATAVAQIGAVYKIVTGAQTMTSYGAGYTAVPRVTISPGPGDTTGSGAEAYATVDGVSGLTYGMVYQLTSLAVTPSGARAMTQMEVATPVRGLAMTGALTLAGPQPVVDSLPNSTQFFVDGTDSSDGSNVARVPGSALAPTPAGCDTTAKAPTPAIGAYDDPNASVIPPESSVDIIKDAIPAGRTNNYQGSGPSPDVQNISGALGDTLTSPTGMMALIDSVKSAAGATVFPSNYDMDHLGPFGSATSPVINVVDGDLTLQGSSTGYGILVVTGSLVLGGNFSWNGLVLVVGDGRVTFSGGGGGQINGELLVANIWNNHTDQTLRTELGSPELSWSGGGGNGVFYNHCWADDMLTKFPFLPPPSTKQLKIISTRTVTY